MRRRRAPSSIGRKIRWSVRSADTKLSPCRLQRLNRLISGCGRLIVEYNVRDETIEKHVLGPPHANGVSYNTMLSKGQEEKAVWNHFNPVFQ